MYIIIGVIGAVTSKYLNKEEDITFINEKEKATTFENKKEANDFLNQNKNKIKQVLKDRYRSSKVVGDKVIESIIPSINIKIIKY